MSADQFAGVPYDRQAKTVNIDGDVYELAADRLDLPAGFTWEYYTCENGGGSIWNDENGQQHSTTITPTVMKRAVGPWQVERERKTHDF